MPTVAKFHQIIVWPLQLKSSALGLDRKKPWELLTDGNGTWKEVDDEFSSDPTAFQERHYREFSTFLPYVQRLLYGEGAAQESFGSYNEPSMKTFRRGGVSKVRIAIDDRTSVILDVVHADLIFFHDMEVAILAVEVRGTKMPLNTVQELLYRFARAYPSAWSHDGEGLNCPKKVEWLAADDRVLAASDYEDRQRYLAHVGRERAPAVSSHWEFLLAPMVPIHSDRVGRLRFQHLENHRMPTLTYLTVDDPCKLTRADFVRLAFATGPGNGDVLPFPDRFLVDFESIHCYDRYYDETGRSELNSRALFSNNIFVVVGDENRPLFTDPERGVLGQFRHQFFLLGLLAHFQKAALLLMSERMVKAVSRLDVGDLDSVRRFRSETRQSMEIFLRFTHRYWVHDVSDQPVARDLFYMFTKQLGTDRMYVETREELKDMVSYLDSELLRRQSNGMLRLTVVTIIGLVGTTVTGFLGMNIFSIHEESVLTKSVYFATVALAFALLTAYTLTKSRALAEFLDVLSAERIPATMKVRAFLKIWKRS